MTNKQNPAAIAVACGASQVRSFQNNQDANATRVRKQLADLKARLTPSAGSMAVALLGKPTSTSKHEMRWGKKGSLVVHTCGPRQGLFHSFEDGKGGDMFDLVQREIGCNFPTALQWVADFLGIDGAPTPTDNGKTHRKIATDRTYHSLTKEQKPVTDYAAERTSHALTIWRNATPIRDTLAEVYLRQARKIDWPNSRWPDDLRFHARLRLVGHCPALVALIRDIHTGAPKAVQATALLPDGSNCIRNEHGKKLCKTFGPAKSGAIMLTPFDEVTLGLGLAEGLETALSVLDYGWRPMWVTIGKSGLASFPVLSGIETLTIWGDNDAGKNRNSGIEAAATCGVRWRDAGIEAAIRYPRRGGDWNDVIKARAVA